jgi:hypothetical protein
MGQEVTLNNLTPADKVNTFLCQWVHYIDDLYHML